MTHYEAMIEAQLLALEGQQQIATEFGGLFRRFARRLGDLLNRHGKLDPI